MKKSTRIPCKYLSAGLLLVMALCLSTASWALPARHKALMANEEYKSAYESYTATLAEAKKRIAASVLDTLVKKLEAEMAEGVATEMEAEVTEAEAWSTAYLVGVNTLEREINHQWLRENPKGAQGLFQLRSDTFDGIMAIFASEESNLYEVSMEVLMKKPPHNSGDMENVQGRLNGNVMTVVDRSGENAPIELHIQGDTIEVRESKAFKDRGLLGEGVTFDGQWVRVRP